MTLSKQVELRIIDADTHVDETEDTWAYMEPHEAPLVPTTEKPAVLDPSRPPIRYWNIGGKRATRFYRSDEKTQTTVETRELLDVPARLRAMDAMGVDVQIIYPTLFAAELQCDPATERALRRSYNRWMADRCEQSSGRLRWIALPPLRTMDESIQELRFAKQHGAVGILKKGDREAGAWVSDEYFFPLYEEAQRLDLPVCFHVGTGNAEHVSTRDMRVASFSRMIFPVQNAFHTLILQSIPQRFAGVRWGFIEAAAGWVPYALHDLRRRMKKRSNLEGSLFGNTPYNVEGNLLEQNHFWVSCLVDEDLPYLIQHVGENHLLAGSDYTHADPAIEHNFHLQLQERADNGEISHSLVQHIVSDNPRAFYGLD